LDATSRSVDRLRISVLAWEKEGEGGRKKGEGREKDA
jgi:hypothetical protein